MSFKRVFLLFIVFSVFSVFSNGQTYNSYEEMYQKFYKLKPNPNKVISLSKYRMSVDIGDFNFNSGKIYLFEKISDHINVAVFIGDGDFSFVPSLYVESVQLERYFGKKTFESKFYKSFFIINDNLLNQITSKFTPKSDYINEEVEDFFETNFNYFKYDTKKYAFVGAKDLLFNDISYTIMNNKNNDFFYSCFENNDTKYFWRINPYVQEEVSFGKLNSHIKIGYYEENVCKFPKMGKEINIIDNNDKNNQVNTYLISNFDLESNIITVNNTLVKCNMDIISKDDDLRWINISLFDQFTIDSVKSKNNHLDFFYSGYGYLWIKLDKIYKSGEPIKIELSYQGNYMERFFNTNNIRGRTSWYPHNLFNYRTKSNFKVKFLTHKNEIVNGSGKIISEIKNDDFRTTIFESEKPIYNFVYTFGEPFSRKIEQVKSAEIDIVYYNSSQLEPVMEDIALSFDFFSNLFGKLEVEKLKAIDNFFGDIYLSVIPLSDYILNNADKYRHIELYTSQNVAEQWWNASISYNSYRENWISSSLTSYSGMYYVQTVLKDNDNFFNFLQKSKEGIMNVKKGGYGNYMELGSFVLDYRNDSPSSRSSGWLETKATWVIHMIRNLMIDLKTMKDDRFLAMLKEFFQTYQGKYASTEGFKKIVEKYAGQDMTWFFNQWVYGNKIPKYTFGYKTTQNPDGKFKVTCRIKQEDVDKDFAMPIPILIDFGENRFYPMRVIAKGPLAEFDLPPLPLEPKKITFNSLESVLCEYDTTDFDDIK